MLSLGLDRGLIVDPYAVEGAKDLPYSIAHQKTLYTHLDPGVPIGFWRSVGHSHTAFAVESMIDELAQKSGADPVAFRRSHLSDGDRHRGVLDQVAAMCEWDKPTAQPAAGRRARGVAVHACFGSFCAQVIQVVVVGETLYLEQVWCAVDCGFVLNPMVAAQQVEGGIIFALSAATRQEITFKDGATVQKQISELGLLSLSETPTITVAFVRCDDAGLDPSGIGEVAVPPAAPALASAVARATGKRQRKLPLAFTLGRGR